MDTISTEATYTLQFVNQTQRSIFLTGKAGTGKTTLLQQIKSNTHKNTAIVAPTGIAALNAGGVTIHSFFQLPFHAFAPTQNTPVLSADIRFETQSTLSNQGKISGAKKAILRNLELLIIDEVSMLRADLLDAIDFILQTIRQNRQPFGGVQVLFIGDLLQLPPVINEQEWQHLKSYYAGKFFFHAHVIQKHPPLYIELPTIYRQHDPVFISILANLRHNKITPQDVQTLNQYVDYEFATQKNDGYITLTTHNYKADQINAEALALLPGKKATYFPEIVGEFPDKIAPLDFDLELKVGAQIMFIKNDIGVEKNFYNGKMGQIKSLSTAEIVVFFPEENHSIVLEKYEWQNLRYTIDPITKELKEEVIGTYVQYPIKLAWAITIHKSQGLTFQKAIIDVSHVFMPGQAYVALSRLRSLEGLVLMAPLQLNGMLNNQDVMDYANNKVNPTQLEHLLIQDTNLYVWHFLKTTFSWPQLHQAWQDFYKNRIQQKSKKSAIQQWSVKQLEKLQSIQEPATKFGNQLDRLLQPPLPNWSLIAQRVEAAFNYFFPVLDTIETELIDELLALQLRKKNKTLTQDLQAIEALQTTAILQLYKAKLLVSLVAEGKKIDKQSLQDSFFREYKTQKIANRIEVAQLKSGELLPDPTKSKKYPSQKVSKPKSEKKSTLQETYALWEQNYSIEDIAKIRVLTPQTIVSHLAKLIENELISIESVLPIDRITQLKNVFKGEAINSLQAIKEQSGDEFSWDELKLFKASLAPRNSIN